MHPIPAYDIPEWKYEKLLSENPNANRSGFRKLVGAERPELIGQLREDETLYAFLRRSGSEQICLVQNQDRDRYNDPLLGFRKRSGLLLRRRYTLVGFYGVSNALFQKYFIA